MFNLKQSVNLWCSADLRSGLFFLQDLAAAERARKQAEAERDELADELASNASGKWVAVLF